MRGVVSCSVCAELDRVQAKAKAECDRSGLLDVAILRQRHAEAAECDEARAAALRDCPAYPSATGR